MFRFVNTFDCTFRCNDVLELVQTTRHFRLLADAAEVGGAGSQSLDALVKEIHLKYSQAMNEFFSQVTNVLAIDGSHAFEKAFFTFRTVVKVSSHTSVKTLTFWDSPSTQIFISMIKNMYVIFGYDIFVYGQKRIKDDNLEWTPNRNIYVSE